MVTRSSSQRPVSRETSVRGRKRLSAKPPRKANPSERRYLRDLSRDNTLVRLDWPQWLAINAPYEATTFTTRDLHLRFRRNGYDWDVHGTLYEPAREIVPNTGFVMLHGGAGSEKELDETPDGRPGLAAVVAAQGFRCLAITFVGHYPVGGEWTVSVARRQPVYLLDRVLPAAEIRDRNLKCTFNVHVEGAARLIDRHMAGYDLLGFGHSTGGPMVVALHRFLERSQVIGILGWGSGEPNGWGREWAVLCNGRPEREFPLHSIARRTTENFSAAGYADHPALCPWGGVDEYMAWGNRFKSQMKTALCDNQHRGNITILKRYAALTGLPPEEYLDHLRDPDPKWLAKTPVLLLIGEHDVTLWSKEVTAKGNRQLFIAEKFAMRTPRTRVVLVPKYGHFGFVGIQNETIAHSWLWAFREGYFT